MNIHLNLLRIILILILSLPQVLRSQSINLHNSVNEGAFPEITFFMQAVPDSAHCRILRAEAGKQNFIEINTLNFVNQVNDTCWFWLMDTTLIQKGIYLYKIETLLNDQTITSPAAMGHNFGFMPKPQINEFSAKALEARKAIELKWETNYSQTISTLSLYRSRSFDSAYVKVAELDPESSSYIDVVPLANEAWFYFIMIHDFFGSQIPGVRIPAFATFSEKPVSPINLKAEIEDKQVKLRWDNPGKNIVGFRVYRRIDQRSFELTQEMIQNKDKEQFYTDDHPGLQLAKNVQYYVRLVSDGFQESESSDTLSFYFPGHHQLTPPKGFDYQKTSEGCARLFWEINPNEIIKGYNIYLDGEGVRELKLNDNLIRLNFFTDTVYRIPGKYHYSIESVGLNDEKSLRRSSLIVHHQLPILHIILNLKLKDEGIELSWEPILYKHIRQLQLYRNDGSGKSVFLEQFENVSVKYLDSQVERGKPYYYSLIGILNNGDELILNEGVDIRF